MLGETKKYMAFENRYRGRASKTHGRLNGFHVRILGNKDDHVEMSTHIIPSDGKK